MAMMSPLSVLVKSAPFSRTRPVTLPPLVSTKHWSQQSCKRLRGNIRWRTYSSNSSASSGSDTLYRGLGGFVLGVALTGVGFYVSQQNSIKQDGHTVDAVGPDNAQQAAAKRTRDATPDLAAQASHYASPEEIQQAIKELKDALPEKDAVTTDKIALQSYGHSDNSYHPTSPHSVVVRPQSTEDVVKIVNIARKYRVPIVPYSGATSLEGHFSGVR